MADKIVIEGNTVTLIQEVIKNSGTLEQFLDKLNEARPPLLDGIPPGCLAISARENSITYFVYVEGHVTKIKYKDIGPNYDNAVTMFVPNAIWAITLGIKSGVYSPAGAWWHFTVDQPNGLVKDVKAYQNFFPNVALHTNSICFGEAFTPDRRSSNPSEVVSAVVDSIEHSYFNRHWTDGKYNNTLKIKVN